ncbi:MAG: ABC transporter permease [Actinomycetota bacterium]|nr:ABC transporter permease [Actinomycetota bacterium]
MFHYLIGRLLWAVVLFVTMTMVTYVLFFLIPASPTQIGRGQFSEQFEIRDAYALHGPVYEEWARFVWGIVTEGELGISFVNRRPVSELILSAAPVTASLIIGGAILWMLLAIPLGILSGLRPRSLLDRAGMVFVLVGISTHPVWLGLMFRYLFSARLGWAPPGGYCDLIDPQGGCGGPRPWFSHLIVPWFTFALLFAALYVRMIRASVMETVQEDYVRTAYAKGASRWLVIRRHILRNAMLPIVAMLSVDMSVAIAGPVGGAVFVERVFGLPGLGTLALESLPRRDVPVILGVVVAVMIVVLVLNLIADLVYSLIDPRVHTTGQAHEPEDRRVARPDPVPAAESA